MLKQIKELLSDKNKYSSAQLLEDILSSDLTWIRTNDVKKGRALLVAVFTKLGENISWKPCNISNDNFRDDLVGLSEGSAVALDFSSMSLNKVMVDRIEELSAKKFKVVALFSLGNGHDFDANAYVRVSHLVDLEISSYSTKDCECRDGEWSVKYPKLTELKLTI